MSRRPVSDIRLQQLAAAAFEDQLDREVASFRGRSRRDLLDEPSTGVRKKPTGKRPPNYKRVLQEMTKYGGKVVEGLWECAEPRHLVGLYASLHAHLYGLPPLELEQEYGGALASATKLVKDEFKGQAIDAQPYVAWCFARGRKWKKQSEADGAEVVRVGWRLVFKSRKWLVDYRANGR